MVSRSFVKHGGRAANVSRPTTRMYAVWAWTVSVAALLTASYRAHADPDVEVMQGAAIFQSDCAGCHGRTASGGRGPDLTRGLFRHAHDDGALFRVIAVGIPGSAMPGALAHHSTEDIWRLVRYVRSLVRTGVASTTTGSALAGQQLFHGRGACSTCHRVDGRDTPVGPGLADIGQRRTADALRTALLRPNPEAPPAWWFLRVTTASGIVHRGRRMDEDTFSVRLIDERGTLWSFQRAAVRSIESLKASTMLDSTTGLTPAEVDDLVAYLGTLAR
jgi:cytochrome c oxidase cbb3-type subunit III